MNATDEKILLSLAKYHFVTVNQMVALHYSKGSIKYAQSRLKLLTDKKLIKHLKRESVNFPFIYTLAPKGIELLRTLGVCATAHSSAYSHMFLKHWLSTNDFLISAELLVLEGLETPTIYHDLTLKHMLTGKVIPDGYIDFRHNGTQLCLWLELDRGTMEQKDIKAKARNIVNWCSAEYINTFNTTSLNIVYATTHGQKRMDYLFEWVSSELRSDVEASWFMFASVPEGQLDPGWLFCEPIFRRIGVEGYISIL